MTQKTEKELYEMLDNFQLSKNDGRITHGDLQLLVEKIMHIIDVNSSMYLVYEFMSTFQQKVRDVSEMPTVEECKFRLELCKEELVEIAEACGSEVLSDFGLNLYKTSEEIRNYVENQRESLQPSLLALLDGFKDLEYVLKGFELTAGMSDISEEAFLEVHNSNMSKACNSLEETNQTIEKYALEGISVNHIISKKNYLVRRNSDNKILKSINYKPAELGKFLNLKKINEI